MSIQEARRAAFEKWWSTQGSWDDVERHSDGEYVGELMGIAWRAWNVALDSVVVGLNSHLCYDQPGEAYQAIQDCAEAIEAAGIRCEVKS